MNVVAKVLLIGWLAGQVVAATAQEYPSRPVSIVIGYAPGGAVDIPARYFARRLAEIGRAHV